MKMRKNLLVILTAGLLLLSVTACNKKPGKTDDTNDDVDTAETTGSYIVVETDTDGNPVNTDEPETKEPETEGFDPSEENPTFTDATMEIVVVSSVATVRTSTQVLDNNAVGWPKEGKKLTVTGVSANWYRINYPVDGEDQTCYISKTVAGDVAIFDTFKAIEGGEEVEVTADSLNIRSYPSADYSIEVAVRGTLLKGTKVTRVAVSENWSRISVEIESETKEYYVSNAYIKAVETETEAGTEAATEAATTENAAQ